MLNYRLKALREQSSCESEQKVTEKGESLNEGEKRGVLRGAAGDAPGGVRLARAPRFSFFCLYAYSFVFSSTYSSYSSSFFFPLLPLFFSFFRSRAPKISLFLFRAKKKAISSHTHNFVFFLYDCSTHYIPILPSAPIFLSPSCVSNSRSFFFFFFLTPISISYHRFFFLSHAPVPPYYSYLHFNVHDFAFIRFVDSNLFIGRTHIASLILLLRTRVNFLFLLGC